jgi:hypothetical protein
MRFLKPGRANVEPGVPLDRAGTSWFRDTQFLAAGPASELVSSAAEGKGRDGIDTGCLPRLT